MRFEIVRSVSQAGMRALTWISVVVACGCTADVTQEPRYRDLLHHCFRTVQEAALVHRNCASLLTDHAYCDGLVELPFPGIPGSEEEYLQDTVGWDLRVQTTLSQNYRYYLNGGNQVTRPPDMNIHLAGFLRSGTRVEIVRVVREKTFEDSASRFEAVIQSGAFVGRRFRLPEGRGYGDLGWIVVDGSHSAPGSLDVRANSDHLSECGPEG